MSSVSGGRNVGGENEDVEADESMRTEDARPGITDDQGDGESDEEFGTFSQPQQGGFEEEDLAGWDEELDEIDLPVGQDDYLQLQREQNHAYGDESPDIGPSRPIAASPAKSPADSGSIPDDSPSVQGSLASSPVRIGSPRRIPSRTTSGALQPFERRFETKLSASPTTSPRGPSPSFLSPHSRQISLSSQLSQVSSQDEASSEDAPQAPWDVVKWTSLRRITSQAFSEAGRRNFGRPTCLAVSAFIAVGTSKGLVLGFDYHQTLKIIIGQGTTATECGSVTAVAIAADFSTVVAGHANGHIFTWEVNRPARPFLRIPPISKASLAEQQHPDGHLEGCAILHIGFLGTRHTALVSADAGGMAFSHLATRGLGPVTRTIKSTRLLGRYPSLDPGREKSRKPSSVLAFAPLPLGNVEQPTDEIGLTALLTPYLLVIVSTTPIAQTQHKSPRPKEIKPHSTLSGCLAWFPAVKLKASNQVGNKSTSDTKLAYCWSNLVTVLDVHSTESEETNKPPALVFNVRARWHADEAIVAIQWLGRSVLGLLTISQRLLILEDGKLQVTDSIDLLHRRIYHQDLFSEQLQSVVENLESSEPDMHGVVADAFHMSFKVYKGRIFLLGFDGVLVGTLSNWADRLMALMEAGDHIAAIRLATEYYIGGASNVAVGLPDAEAARHTVVRERLTAMVAASLQYTFSQHSEGRNTRISELADVSFNACIRMGEADYLFNDIFDIFQEAEEDDIFITTLEPYVLDGEVKTLPPEVIKSLVSHFISEGQSARLEDQLCRLDPLSFDLDQITVLCRQHNLYDALIYVWTRAIGDFVTPLIDLLSLVLILDGDDDERNPYFESAMKIYPYLAYSLTGRRYPGGDFMEEDDATVAKTDLYGYVFSGRTTAWPHDSQKVFQTAGKASEEPAYPYLVLLLEFDASNFMSMLNEAFEDAFLNEPEEDSPINGTNAFNGRQSIRMTRQHIVEIMLDVMQHHEFETEQVTYLDMFIARSLSKYPGQLVLSGSLLSRILQRLCLPPTELLRDDCQLSVEYLLSTYHPPDTSVVVKWLRQARFFRVLKSVYRVQKMFPELIEVYFEDPEDKHGVFDGMKQSLQATVGSPARSQAVKDKIREHFSDLAEINTTLTAHTLSSYAKELLEPAVDALDDPQSKFIFLRTLLEPSLLPGEKGFSPISPLSTEEQGTFTEHYVQLMCSNDPKHVADYVGLLPSGDLKLDNVLPAMEKSGVVDAAVVLLARDGLARDAMDRLVAHLRNLQSILSSLIESAAQSPDAASTREAAEDLTADINKYTKVGIWLCQGQTANTQRRQRRRHNVVQDLTEDDLDLDEYLWLGLVDAVVHVTKDTTAAIQSFEAHPIEVSTEQVGFAGVVTALRRNVQEVFTSLLAATSTSTSQQQQTPSNQTGRPSRSPDNLSFIRVLGAFLTRAASTSPSLSDLREVLSDIFSAYTFEQGVLSLANELLGSDVFVDIEAANKLRQRGWRPRSQVCEHCKRRAWGQGIGEHVWDAWVDREQAREHDKARRLVERGGGEEARKLERGKAKASSSATTPKEEAESGETRRLALIVFACRHVFHRVCLDPEYRDGRPGRAGAGVYKCPICK